MVGSTIFKSFYVFIFLFQQAYGKQCRKGCNTTVSELEYLAAEESLILFDPDFTHEPPINQFLANSTWPMSHRNPYAQASSPYAGPEINKEGETSFSSHFKGNAGPGLITLCFSSPYSNGDTAVWASTGRFIIKASTSLRYIDKIRKDNDVPNQSDLLSGAYTLIDTDNIFYVPSFKSIHAYGDKQRLRFRSGIELNRTFDIPDEKTSHEDEVIVGMTLTFDGFLAFVTSRGLLGVVSRDFNTSHFYTLPGGDQESISNSISCDEKGGIFIVSSLRMYRINWTGIELSDSEDTGAWVANYENQCGPEVGVLSLGGGSGSTPSLMGTDEDDDRFVVITDCQDVMNLVLFWRDDIPRDWVTLPGTADRRIAGQIPVQFGNPDANNTFSEQSVLVRGYGALVVNNEIGRNNSTLPPLLISGVDSIAPKGVEKFQWDPSNRSLQSTWVNKEVSIPNGIPTMSQKSNLMYGVSHGPRFWSFAALNWTTGELVFDYPYGNGAQFNSAYAGTEIGPFGGIYTGVLNGIVNIS